MAVKAIVNKGYHLVAFFIDEESVFATLLIIKINTLF